MSRFRFIHLGILAVSILFISAFALAQEGGKRSVPPAAPDAALQRPGPLAANGNIDGAHARIITSDGAAYNDSITNANPSTWFTFPIYHDHSYVFEVYAPYNNLLNTDPILDFNLFEADGTTAVSATFGGTDEPAMFHASTGIGGERAYKANTGAGTDRYIKMRVFRFPAPTASVGFWVRVIDTTLMAARFTVNGYRAQFALHNISNNANADGAISYYAENGAFLGFDSFSILPNGSTQIIKANSVPIGGQLVGGVRVIFDIGQPGQVSAWEYNLDPTRNQFIFFEFKPVFQSGLNLPLF